MRALFILIIGFLMTSCATTAQNIERNSGSKSTITIDAVGEVSVPADQIRFQINLVQFDENARTAFSRHKELEEFLTGLIKEEGIASENIRTEPVSIRPAQRGQRGEERGFETSQQVSLVLDDIDQFENMQLLLVENGFDNFSAQFGSSKMKDAEEDALANAIESARTEAGILAEAAGLTLGEIVSIQHGSTPPQPFYRSMAMNEEMAYSGGSLLDFEQFIPVKKNVWVQFVLIAE